MNKYSSVIVTGSIGYDIIMDFPGKFVDYIEKDKLHQINISFVVDTFKKQLGGTATNIAYNLSLLTKNKTKILGTVGKDGDELLNFLKENKIDTNGVLRNEKHYSSSGSAITDKNDNQIWGYCYGAAISGNKIKITNAKSSIVVVSANHPKAFLNFQNSSIKLNIDYLYDVGMCLTWINKDDLFKGIKHCHWLVGNDYEISLIQKMLNLSINQLIESGISVITTLGEKGVKYQDKKNNLYVPAYKVKKVVDPTGAGDAWRGGFLAGILIGKNTVDSLKLGNAMASFAVEKYGTVNHRPTIKEVNERIKKL